MPVPGPEPGIACLQLLSSLVSLLPAQDGHGLAVDGDDAGPASRLGLVRYLLHEGAIAALAIVPTSFYGRTLGTRTVPAR